MNDGNVLFNQYKFPSGKLVSTGDIVFTGAHDNCRVYMDLSNNDNSKGFDVVCMEFGSCPCPLNDLDAPDYWILPEMEARVIFVCSALFDGIRHIWFNPEERDMLGYLNYPSIQELSSILSRLRELELQYCSSPDL